MRAILDSHGEVRCGEESRIIPRMLAMRDNWLRNKKEEERLVQAGVDSTVIDAAISAFVLETIAKHGEPARVLCNKDPLTLKWGGYLANIFPNSKWIFMVRDGRAVIHSVITRKVTISGYKLDDPRQCLGRWNNIVKTMNEAEWSTLIGRDPGAAKPALLCHKDTAQAGLLLCIYGIRVASMQGQGHLGADL